LKDLLEDIKEQLEKIKNKKIILSLELNIGSFFLLNLLSEEFKAEIDVIIFSFMNVTSPNDISFLISQCMEYGVDYIVFEAEDIASLIAHRLKPYTKIEPVPVGTIRNMVRTILLKSIALTEGKIPLIGKSLTDLVISPEPRLGGVYYPLAKYTDSQLLEAAEKVGIGRAVADRFSKKVYELGELRVAEVDEQIAKILSKDAGLLCEAVEDSAITPCDLEDMLIRNICLLNAFGWEIWR